jgi:ParB-like chromosome segregation protein Spo0J
MEIKTIKLSKLKSNTGQVEGLPKNPRLIKNDKYEKLKNSIKADPEMLELREIIAYDNDGELIVICGNMRLKAMQELGFKETTVKVLPQNTSIEKLKAYTIKDNVGFGEHDFDLLANEWDEVELKEWGLDVPVFENIESDYSDKNKEIDTDEFSDKMEIKLLFSSDEYQFIQSELSKIDANKELALLKLLKYES